MDIIKELRRWKQDVEAASGGKVLVRCPFPNHEDKNPSCQVRLEDTEDYKAGDFFCSVCQKGGSFYELLGYITKTPAAVHKKALTGKNRTVSAKKVEAWYASMHVPGKKTAPAAEAFRELEKRGLTSATAKQYNIGYDNENRCITIPIIWGGQYVNISRYIPGGSPKFLNYGKGYGKLLTLFPDNQLHYDKIVLCGGPIKALVVAQELNKYGYGAVSFFGERSIPLELAAWLYGKKVYVCFDIDAPGVIAANKTCAVLRPKTSWVGRVDLPISIEAYPKGDVNDYFSPDESFTGEDFRALLEATEPWEPKNIEEADFDAPSRTVDIKELWGYKKAFNFKTTAYLSGIDDSTAHKVSKRLKVSCTNDHEHCALCKLGMRDGYDPVEGLVQRLNPKDSSSLTFINLPKRMRKEAYKEYFGIPEQCCKCTFEPSEEMYTIRYILLSDTETDSELPIAAIVITDGEELHCGETCSIEGRVDQSPMTSEEIRLVTSHTPKDILSQYVIKDVTVLEQFRPDGPTLVDLERKIDDINHDLERNVTFIYDRPEVHTLFDLAFHSPLYIPFENAIEPGWVSVLLVSETAQGKSTIMRRLLKHYGHGAYIDAANTSIAGLIGGIKSVGKRQFVKWGVLPQMDKRFVCIEEYAAATVELLRSMRSTRDSGYVVLNKIDKGRARARARTVVMSNPKKILIPGVVVDGVSLLEDLVERPEDLRRFDAGMWMPKIDTEKRFESDEPKYSTESCHELITWAWTLPVEEIRYTDEAIQAICKNKLKARYPYLYLVGSREFDTKLARLAAAIATRTYNVIDGKLVIEERHVQFICNFLCNLYDDPEFGYVNRVRREDAMDDQATTDQILSTLKLAGNPLVICEFLMMYNKYTEGDLKAAIGDSFAYEQVKNKLVIMGCIVGEESTKWNSTYLPTKRLKKCLPDIKVALARQYAVPKHLQTQNQEM